MSYTHRISIIDLPEKDVEEIKKKSNCETQKKPADFDTALAAAGYGNFQYILLLAIIPVSWAPSLDTSNMSMIVASAECDLQLTLFHKGILNAVVYFGMVSSGFLWGYLADVKGRRNILIYGYLADGIFNFLSGFSQGFWTLVFFKFMCGFIISGPYASLMSYVSEFYGVRERARITLVVGFSIATGGIVNAALAWLIIPQDWSIILWDGAFVYNSWRMYLSACGVPTLIGVICLSFFPESPKFLMSKGRHEDALKILRRIYSRNTGNREEDYPIKHLADETAPESSGELSSTEKDKKAAPPTGMNQMKEIFFYPHLPRLLLVVTMQFCGMLAMNTIRLWQPQLFAMLHNLGSMSNDDAVNRDPTFCEILDATAAKRSVVNVTNTMDDFVVCENMVVSDSVYMDNIIIAATGNVCLLLASVLLNVLNHKNLLFISYGVSLLCLISMNWSSSAMLTLVLSCLFLGLMNTSLNIVIGAAVILFPTTLRTMAVSLEMMVGRTGSIIGNLLFPVLLAYGCIVPIITLAIFTLMCVILTSLLPVSRK